MIKEIRPTKEEIELRRHYYNQGMKKFYIAFPFIVILAILFLFIFWSSLDKSHIKLQCSIKDIEYRDVRPYNCWGDTDHNQSIACPLPHNINCVIEGSSIGNIIGSMISGVV